MTQMGPELAEAAKQAMGQPAFSKLFLGAGAMKAGTTWLYAVLRDHPDLHFSLEKELHYFFHAYSRADFLSAEYRLERAKNRYVPALDSGKPRNFGYRDRLRWISNYVDGPVNDTWYQRLFDLRKPSTYACDFSNLTCHLKADDFADIAKKTEQLRVLYVMRDPLSRLWSHVKFQLEIEGRLEVLDQWGPREFDQFVRQSFLWDNAEYGAAVARMKRGLPANALKLMFYEDIHRDQAAALTEVEDFLGLSHHIYPKKALSARVTKSVSRPMPEFFAALFLDDIARICAELEDHGLTLPPEWTRRG